MIKSRLSKLALYASTASIGWIATLSLANADGGGATTGILSLFGFDFTTFLASVAAWISNMMLSIMGVWVSMTGALLNVSITLTLQIKDFVESTQGVYVVWQTIRDVSGMFIIFMLLYASFKMILSQDDLGTSVGSLIKNVVIMGILINFSFFIVSLLIDASNIVSLTLYRSIVAVSSTTPATLSDAQIAKDCRPDNGQALGTVNTCVTTSQTFKGTQGGLADVFMAYLKPQSIYSYNGPSDPNTPQDAKPMAILIQGIVGSIIMFTMGLSFLIAALAFVIRFLILVLLLAFSPIWFAAYVIPELKSKSDHFLGHLKDQLVFMPVYLLLLYASLRILSTSTVFTHPSGDVFSGSGTWFSNMIKGYSILAVNDFFIIFLLNIPLVTAIGMSGLAGELTSKLVDPKKFGAEAIWKKIGASTGRNLYQGTVSRGASAIGRSEGLKNWAAKSQIGEYALKGVKKTASSYDARLESQVKERTGFAESLGADKKRLNQEQSVLRSFEQQLSSARTRNAAPNIISHLEGQIKQTKQNITGITNARKAAYAGRTDTKQVDTLFTKVARKDKVAAARLQIDIYKKELEQRQKSLDEKRGGIKDKKKDITRLQQEITAGTAAPGSQGLIAQWNAELQRMYNEENTLLSNPTNNMNTMGTNDLQRKIDEFTLTT
jgi:hypothetical protein